VTVIVLALNPIANAFSLTNKNALTTPHQRHHHKDHATIVHSSSTNQSKSSSSPPLPPTAEKCRDATSISHRANSVESFKVMDVLQRANELEASGREILHCEVGQPETGAPATVAEAAVAALTKDNPRDVLGYTDAFGLMDLRKRIAGHYLAKYEGIDESVVDVSQIVVTTGSSGGFLLAFTSCFDVGDVVAVASSGYPCYRNILSALGCELATIGINREFKITAKELGEEIARRREAGGGEKPISGLILSSPSNPTGAMLSPEELKGLCELCDEEGIQFISDEIYHGISYGKKEATALTYSKSAIVINSFSKYYSMSGWRLGWMVIPSKLIPPINALQQNMFISPPTISQTAAMKCWDDDTISELETHVNKYRQSRDIILNALSKLPHAEALQLAPSDGGFYVYVDLGDENVPDPTTMGSVALCRAFLEEEGVAFTPGVDFEDPEGGLGNRRFRISYAGGVDTVTRAMERFTTFWPLWRERARGGVKLT